MTRETNGFVFFPTVKDTLGLTNNEYVLLNQVAFLQTANPTGYCTYLGKHRTRPRQKFIEFLCGLVQKEVLDDEGEVIQKGFTSMGMRKMLKRLESRGFLIVDLPNVRIKVLSKFTEPVATVRAQRDEIIITKKKKEAPTNKVNPNINIEDVYQTARVYWLKIQNIEEHTTFEQFDEFQKLFFDAVFKIRQAGALKNELQKVVKEFEEKRKKSIKSWYNDAMSIHHNNKQTANSQ